MRREDRLLCPRLALNEKSCRVLNRYAAYHTRILPARQAPKGRPEVGDRPAENSLNSLRSGFRWVIALGDVTQKSAKGRAPKRSNDGRKKAIR